jgi:hypothetical protein
MDMFEMLQYSTQYLQTAAKILQRMLRTHQKKLRSEVDFDDSEAFHWFDTKNVALGGLLLTILEAYHWFNQILVAFLIISFSL